MARCLVRQLCIAFDVNSTKFCVVSLSDANHVSQICVETFGVAPMSDAYGGPRSDAYGGRPRSDANQ